LGVSLYIDHRNRAAELKLGYEIKQERRGRLALSRKRVALGPSIEIEMAMRGNAAQVERTFPDGTLSTGPVGQLFGYNHSELARLRQHDHQGAAPESADGMGLSSTAQHQPEGPCRKCQNGLHGAVSLMCQVGEARRAIRLQRRRRIAGTRNDFFTSLSRSRPTKHAGAGDHRKT
jgi:hypothetical protein